MTIALVLPKDYHPQHYLDWAMRIMAAQQQPLLLLDVQRSRQEKNQSINWAKVDPDSNEQETAIARAIQTALATQNTLSLKQTNLAAVQPAKPKSPEPNSLENDSSEEEATPTADTADEQPPAPQITLIQIRDQDPVTATLQVLAESEVKLLLLPRHRGIKSNAKEFTLQQELFFQANCTTVQLCLGEVEPSSSHRVMVPTRGSKNTADAIRLATDLAETSHGHVDAIYFQQDIDDAAATVGERIIQRLVDRYADDGGRRVVTQSIVCNDITAGIQTHAEKTADLLVLGASYHSIIHRYLFTSVTEQIASSEIRPAIMIIRQAAPWSRLAAEACKQTISEIVPQLDRQQRVELVERIHGSSRWDFDFIALICLSTLIAGLGLLQNSAAVVIGAMLVAPLMTPLLGAGLALVQGNRLLAASSVGTVVRGFLLALAIGCLLGFAMQLETATPEMLARCSPGISDLVVAFASGLAAAYANGRPNLVSALPGVAIAAALVPPLATAGLVLAMGRIELALGAGLLFFTNIVAIILGAACSLWTVGIRSSHAYSFVASWSTRALLSLVVIVTGLGIYEYTSPLRVPTALHHAITERLERETGTKLVAISLSRSAGSQELQLIMTGPEQANAKLLKDLSQLTDEQFQTPTTVRLETRLVQITN